MNAGQYELLVRNRRAYGPLTVDQRSPRSRQRPGTGGRSPLAAVVHRAARQYRRRVAAEQAWERVIPPKWLGAAAVDRVEGDTVVIAVETATLCYDMRRHATELASALGRLVPGVRRVTFTVSGGG